MGKWHLTPDGQQGPAGPFDRWPIGRGFDYFYGFLRGGASQWDPFLAENQKIIHTPAGFYDEEHPFYLPDAKGDRTIKWLHDIRAQDAHKPFVSTNLGNAMNIENIPKPKRTVAELVLHTAWIRIIFMLTNGAFERDSDQIHGGMRDSFTQASTSFTRVA